MRYKRIAFVTIVSIAVILLAVWGMAAHRPASASTLCRGDLSFACKATSGAKAFWKDYQTNAAANAVSTVTDIVDEGDWPMVAANLQRTSWTPEEVRGKLSPIWYKPIEPYISQKVQIIAAHDTLSSFDIPTSWSNAMDEPIAYASGGDLVYWVRCCDRVGSAFDIKQSAHWIYWSYHLKDKIPGYNELYYDLDDTSDCLTYKGAKESVNGVYGLHGEQNPPVPYKGKVYMHKSNSIIAFGDYAGSYTGLPMAPTVNVQNANITPISTEQLRQQLSQEIQKILDAGHLRQIGRAHV